MTLIRDALILLSNRSHVTMFLYFSAVHAELEPVSDAGWLRSTTDSRWHASRRPWIHANIRIEYANGGHVGCPWAIRWSTNARPTSTSGSRSTRKYAQPTTCYASHVHARSASAPWRNDDGLRRSAVASARVRLPPWSAHVPTTTSDSAWRL